MSRVVSTNISLAQVCGGRSAAIGVFDARAATNTSSFADTIGTALGGTAMSPYVQASAPARPTIANGRLVFSGSQSMTGPRDTRLQFDGIPPLWMCVIGKFTSGPGAYVANDTANGALYPWAGTQAASSVMKGDYAPAAAGTGRVQPQELGVPANDGKVRAIAIGKTSRYALNPGTNEDWRFIVGGTQQQMFAASSVATNVGGGMMPTLGQVFGTFGTFECSHVMFLAADMDGPITRAWLQFAVAEHGAELSTDQYGTIAAIGDSLGYGSQSSDVLSTVINSGTTTSLYVASRIVSGPGNWLSPRKLAVTDMHSCIKNVSGRNPQSILDRWDIDLGPLMDGCRAGKKVLWLRGILNGLQGLNWDTSFTLSRLAAINVRRIADGWDELVLEREIDRTSGQNGAGNARGLYLNVGPDTTLGPVGTTIAAVDAAMVANLSTYGTRLMNPGANAGFTMGTRAGDGTTLYNDGTHLKDAGYLLKGQLNKVDFDGFNLWP